VVLTNDDVEALLEWGAAIAALRMAYGAPIAEGSVPARSMAMGRHSQMRGMTAASPSGGHIGAKLLTVASENAPSEVWVSYLLALVDHRTAEVTALMDAHHITGMRTAATSALAADAAAPRRPIRVAVLGSGFEAWNHLAALTHVREVVAASVFSPTPAKREAFAERACLELGVDVSTVREPADAVVGADLVVCAARAQNEAPILDGSCLAPGATVVSIGSTIPSQREVDVETLRRADRIVMDVVDEVVHHTGDGIAAKQAGVNVAGRAVALADVVAGSEVARRSDHEIVVYKSVGSALQDVVVAELVYTCAVESGVGTGIPAFVVPVRK
jgi:ornithine cyclodeaminase/alanine dehydrogenase